MIIIIKFDFNPDSFIRAALLMLRDQVDIVPVDENGLWAGAALSADDEVVRRRCNQVLEAEPYGHELFGPIIRKLVFFGLRHHSRPWPALCGGLAELLDRGSAFVEAGAGPGGKTMLALRNAVSREVHRLTGFTRLTPISGIMVGEAPVAHNCGDLVALGLSRRNPDLPLVLLTSRGDWLTLKGKVVPVDGTPFRNKVKEDNFGSVWLTYYRSQFIEERNNPSHAARAIPREYWHWLAEGAELNKARKL